MKWTLKSQIFLFDLILSVVILLVAFGIVFTYYVNSFDNIDIYDLNAQIVDAFTKTRINDLNGEEIRQMFINNKIRNIENSVAQQVSEFYYLGEIEYAENLTRFFVADYVNQQFNFNLSLRINDSSVIQLYYLENLRDKDISSASISSVSERIVYGFLNTTDYYGPYNVRVELWE